MCGIVAVYAYGPRARCPDPDRVIDVRDAMATRGPDGQGLWTSNDHRVALGHRRLAIIGLGAQGAQPMVLEPQCGPPGFEKDAALVLTYNGEIYNYAALRHELQSQGHQLRTHTDTEVILHLYEQYGDRLVERLRGMFAFALWDQRRQRMLLARDGYGIKPLYYRDDGTQVWIASQARPLVGVGATPATVSEAALAAFLVLGNIPEPATLWNEIQQVPAGSCLFVDGAGVHKPQCFFSVSDTLREARDGSAPVDPGAQLRDALKDSVAAHLVADVEVGVFLSSGLDSSALLGLATEAHGRLRAVTLGFAEYDHTASDEVPLAREVAARYRAQHVVSTVSAATFTRAWPQIRDAMDQPSIDGVNSWLVSRVAAEAGLKVVLSGLGGDETLGGYPSFARVPRWSRIVKRPAAVPGLGRVTRRTLTHVPLFGVSPKVAGIVEYGTSIERLWFLQRGLFMPWELPMLLGEERAQYALNQLDVNHLLHAAVTPDPGTDAGRIAALESSLYMRNQLLRDADWASMAHSLEVRVPLVDTHVLPAIAPLLLTQDRPGDLKRVLGATPRPQLPASLTNRPKSGFSVPLGQWLTRLNDHDGWKRIPQLKRADCPWARRWAYIVADGFGVLDG
jgi:asparagine synthase (glutamine-hydrolysing)